MPAGYLRIPADGPYAGNPPVVAGPDLASIIGFANGVDADAEFSPVDTLVVGLAGFGGPAYDLTLSRPTRVGARYIIDGSFSLKAPSSTLSHLFTPRWNRRVQSTGLWVATDALAPEFGAGAKMTSPNNHGVTTVGQINTVNFRTLWDADAECDRVKLSITCDTGVTAAQYLAQAQCYLTVWELGGV